MVFAFLPALKVINNAFFILNQISDDVGAEQKARNIFCRVGLLIIFISIIMS
jgi:hypothetical protein